MRATPTQVHESNPESRNSIGKRCRSYAEPSVPRNWRQRVL